VIARAKLVAATGPSTRHEPREFLQALSSVKASSELLGGPWTTDGPTVSNIARRSTLRREARKIVRVLSAACSCRHVHVADSVQKMPNARDIWRLRREVNLPK
jgi:hypothetical protein